DIVTDGATVSGTFPVSGSIHSIADGTLAGVSFATTSNPASDGAPNPQNEFELWNNTVSVTTRAVNFKYLTLRQIGSIANADLANFKLYVDGVQIGSTVAALDSNGYVTFDITSSPKKLEAGNRVFKVLVDIVGGSTRTTSLSLRYAADAIFSDTEYGSTILVQANSTTFTARTSTAQTIGTGTLTVTKATDSPSVSVVNLASGVSLAKFDLKAAGESIKIENLTVGVVDSENNAAFTLRNAQLYANGVAVGSSFSLKGEADSTATTTINLGSSLIIVPGTVTSLEVKADIYDNDGTNDITTGETLQAYIYTGSDNAQRLTSLGYFDAPSADTAANTLTIKAGGITLAKYTGYANQTAVAPKTAYKLGEWRLTSDTYENVNLTALEIDWDDATVSGPDVATDLSSYYMTYADKTTAVKSTVASTTDSFSINYTLTAGQTITIAAYANVASTITGTLAADLTIRGTASQSTATADSSETLGQVITWSSGSFSTGALEDPLDQIVYGNQLVTAAKYELTASNDDYTLTQFAIRVITGYEAVSGVFLYDGDTALNPSGTPMNVSYATTTGLSLLIPAGTTKTITVKLQLNNIGTGYASSTLNASTTLVSAVVANSSGTVTYSNTVRDGNAVYVFKTFPTLTALTVDGAITNGASEDVFKFKVAPSSAGSVALKQVKLGLNWTDLGPSEGALELDYVKLYRGAVDISSVVNITDEDGNTVEAGSGLDEDDEDVVIQWPTEEIVSTETTYTLKAIPRLFNQDTTSTDSVVVSINNDTSALGTAFLRYATFVDGIWQLSTSASSVIAGTAAEFIWSDRSLVGHSGVSGSSSSDWYNGYYLFDQFTAGTIQLEP
ncbi:MAG: hypothetical protein PHQ47_01680, partial [Candidatus Portnoybacteria bacterium]|nr:hypothetical protein [Candidatus Portnoybacteria bacterium]